MIARAKSLGFIILIGALAGTLFGLVYILRGP